MPKLENPNEKFWVIFKHYEMYQISRFLSNATRIVFQVWCFEVIHLEDVHQFVSEGADVLADLQKEEKILFDYVQQRKNQPTCLIC